ncbi:MAG: hypothetical protein AB7I38_18880 [Dehalococcoidia bacterium]
MIPYTATYVAPTCPSPRWWGHDDPRLTLAAIRWQVTRGAARALRVPEDTITLVEQRHDNGVSVQAIYWPGP